MRAALVICLAMVACSSDGGTASYAPPLPSVVVEDAPVRIRREIFTIDGVTPPPNPHGGKATPPEQNKVRVVRYRIDASPPVPARAVVVMMPGFLAGAGAFDGLARALVRRGGIEAWAIDRRSNLLEDTHGLDVAEVKKDARPAYDYYIDEHEVEGRTFAGFLTGPETPWASEWGLATTVGDLRRVLALVPDKKRVVLLGHSLGASVIEAYAAWDFEGQAGYADLAGLVLADGVSGEEGKPSKGSERTKYEQGDPTSTAGFPQPGVEKDVREGNTFVTLPLLGVQALAVAEAVAIDAVFRPTEIARDVPGRDALLSFALGLPALPKLTNRAAFGFAFDEGSAPLSFAAARCGQGAGGPITSYAAAFGGTLVHPSDPGATYDWIDGPTAGEPTHLAELARGWFEGPGVNFTEWYFPQRLGIDLAAAGSLDVADDDWRSAVYGLRAKHGREIDVPIFAAAFRLVGDVAAFDALRGTVRSDRFQAKLYPDLAHVDGIAGADEPGLGARAFYDDLTAFVKGVTADGGVVVPVR